MRRLRSLIILVIVVVLIVGVYSQFQPSRVRLTLATTTSISDSGLIDFLEESFESRYPEIDLAVIPVGTGRALEIGRTGDVDIFLVHSRNLEEQFVREGYGEHRVTIMYNKFIIVGPKNNPAQISGNNITVALQNIMVAGEDGRAAFVSRGDKSGTHQKELEIWSRLEIDPQGRSWYIEAATGMGGTLRIAQEKDLYILIDSATWIALSSDNGLAPLVTGDSMMLNPYSVILVSKDRHIHVNYDDAVKFISFLVSEEGQGLIERFRVNGRSLFIPIFGKTESIGLPAEDDAFIYWSRVTIE